MDLVGDSYMVNKQMRWFAFGMGPVLAIWLNWDWNMDK